MFLGLTHCPDCGQPLAEPARPVAYLGRLPVWCATCEDCHIVPAVADRADLEPIEAVAKHGYEKARRIGMMAMIGGKDKTIIRNATPPAFRDVLLSLASNARDHRADAQGESK